jgi:hypothetical protein
VDILEVLHHSLYIWVTSPSLIFVVTILRSIRQLANDRICWAQCSWTGPDWPGYRWVVWVAVGSAGHRIIVPLSGSPFVPRLSQSEPFVKGKTKASRVVTSIHPRCSRQNSNGWLFVRNLTSSALQSPLYLVANYVCISEVFWKDYSDDTNFQFPNTSRDPPITPLFIKS